MLRDLHSILGRLRKLLGDNKSEGARSWTGRPGGHFIRAT
jgi:hypothetical protein